jgi:DNA-binding NtrC family response regulator
MQRSESKVAVEPPDASNLYRGLDVSPPLRKPPRVEEGIEVLMISAVDSGFACLQRVLEPYGSRVRRCATGTQALELLQRRATGVVICNTESREGDWKELPDLLARLAPPPLLIVASRLADEMLWVNVINHGGYDLLSVPFEPQETLRVISEASCAYHRKFMEVRRQERALQAKSRLPRESRAGAGGR